MQHRAVSWKPLSRGLAVMLLALPFAVPAAAAVKELANDSFSGIGSIACQLGFLEGESGAVRLTADPGDYPYRVEKVRMLICPSGSSGTVILRLYEDNTGTVNPGLQLFEEIFQVTGSDDAFNEVDLSSYEIVIASGSVRVEIEWMQNSSPNGPGLANDTDGYVPNVNYIFASPPGAWFYANQLGVLGDWIVRMEIETNVGGPDPIFADGFESGDTYWWSVTTP